MAGSVSDLRSLSGGRASSGPSGSSAVPRPKARWRTRVLVPLVVIGAAAGVLLYAARDVLRPRTEVWVGAVIPKAAAGAPAGSTGAPGEGGASETLVQAPGWVEPSPYPISVPALAEGVVHEVLVLEGERVEEGQVVARLLDEDARLALRSAEAALAQRRADVERAQAAVETAEAQVRVERAAAEEVGDEVTRKRGLVDGGAVSVGDFRRLEIRLEGLMAKVAVAERSVAEGRAALKQAETAVQGAGVAIQEADLRLSRTEVRSPAKGVVLSRLVEPGTRISMGGKSGESAGMAGAVLRLFDPARLQVRVDVPLADAAKIGVGTACTITTEALPDVTFRGAVVRVVYEANIQRNTVQFKVSIEEPSPVLKPEMLARVRLHGRGATAGGGHASHEGGETLLVPKSAVIAGVEGKGVVWVVDGTTGAATARRREIETGPSSDEGFAIARSGLRVTDRVVLDPPAGLRDGARLTVRGERKPGGPAEGRE